jgi:hypothetical protein
MYEWCYKPEGQRSSLAESAQGILEIFVDHVQGCHDIWGDAKFEDVLIRIKAFMEKMKYVDGLKKAYKAENNEINSHLNQGKAHASPVDPDTRYKRDKHLADNAGLGPGVVAINKGQEALDEAVYNYISEFEGTKGAKSDDQRYQQWVTVTKDAVVQMLKVVADYSDLICEKTEMYIEWLPHQLFTYRDFLEDIMSVLNDDTFP